MPAGASDVPTTTASTIGSPVPTYQYACTACGHSFEQVQSFSEDSLTTCPQCEGRLRKVYNAVGVVFKGSGFYRTDSRSGAESGSESGGNASDKGEKADKGADKGSDKGEKKSDSGSSTSSGSSDHGSSSTSGSSSSSSSSSKDSGGSGSAAKPASTSTP